MEIKDYISILYTNKNLILHGAPGTGKTFLAKDIAANILFNKSYKDIQKDPQLEKCFNTHTGFVQFHQSYDYTDFVEGLRPSPNGSFKLIPGVFKKFCENALSFTPERLFINYCNMIEEKLNKNGTIDFYQSKKICRIIRDKENNEPYSIEIAPSLKDKDRKQNLSKEIFLRDYLNYKMGFIKSKDDIKPSLESTAETHGNAPYYFNLYKLVEAYEKTTKENSVLYIFIIDEINRGEISKIFGELFYSIDPGYRGKKGNVRTQYANMENSQNPFDKMLNTDIKGNFYIPENVLIIGTMNDIDRSVESMDFAMRRRFIFKEVTAEESAILMKLDSETKKRMDHINKVIERTEGLGKEFQIGASYFLNVSDFNQLWDLKLSSLIKEYLRGIDDDNSKYLSIENAFYTLTMNN